MLLSLVRPDDDAIVALAGRGGVWVHRVVHGKQIELSAERFVSPARPGQRNSESLDNGVTDSAITEELNLLTLFAQSKNLDQQRSRFPRVFFGNPDSHNYLPVKESRALVATVLFLLRA